MNRAELMEISRKAADGTQTAENILTYCKTEAEEGRGACRYGTSAPNENVMNILRSRGLDVTFEAEEMSLRLVWDQEREDAYQAERQSRELSWATPVPRRSGSYGSVRSIEYNSMPSAYATTQSVSYSPPPPQPQEAQQSGSTEASNSISGAIGGVVGWLR